MTIIRIPKGGVGWPQAHKGRKKGNAMVTIGRGLQDGAL